MSAQGKVNRLFWQGEGQIFSMEASRRSRARVGHAQTRGLHLYHLVKCVLTWSHVLMGGFLFETPRNSSLIWPWSGCGSLIWGFPTGLSQMGKWSELLVHLQLMKHQIRLDFAWFRVFHLKYWLGGLSLAEELRYLAPRYISLPYVESTAVPLG